MNAADYLKQFSSRIENDKKYLETIQLYYREKDFANKEGTAAAIAAIALVIAEVIELATGTTNDIKDFISKIKDDIEHIIELLEQVVELLKQLELVIKEEFRIFVSSSLRATLNIIVDSSETWIAGLADPSSQLQTQIEVTNVFTKLQESARMAFQYGYAHYDSMALALVSEVQLSNLLEKPSSFIHKTIDRYITYFENAISYSITDSLARKEKNIVDTISTIKERFIPTKIVTGRQHQVYAGMDGGSKCYADFESTLTIDGSLDKGFTFIEKNTLLENTRQCFERGNDPSKRSFHGSDLSSSFEIKNAQSIKDSYNNAHIFFMNTLIPNLEIIEEAIHSCKRYLERIRYLRSTV